MNKDERLIASLREHRNQLAKDLDEARELNIQLIGRVTELELEVEGLKEKAWKYDQLSK